jgi:hypothetical protein
MDSTDLQMTFIVLVILTAAAMVVFFDQRSRQRRQRRPQRVRSHSHTRSVARTERPALVFDAAPLEFAPARRLAAQRPLEPVVGVAASFRQPRMQVLARETVTVEMAPSSSAANQISSLTTLPAVTIDAELWERLISSHPKQNLLPAAGGDRPRTDEAFKPPASCLKNTIEAPYRMIYDDGVIPSHTNAVVPSQHPRGMIQPPVFEELLKSEAPFTGLVVSIGINDSDSSMWHSQGLMQSVGSYIAGLLRESDFSCRTSFDEFVMVCRGEQGAESQRRLNHVSERLWDYQLRGIGACSILFSWGGVQVQDQALAEAIASATERMRQTKRTGHLAQSTVAHRQAV